MGDYGDADRMEKSERCEGWDGIIVEVTKMIGKLVI